MTPQEVFLEERRSGIGGSDVHHVLSLPPYGCARLLWYTKRGAAPDYSSDSQDYFDRGHALEPIVAEKYAALTGRTLAEHAPAHRHPEHPELLVHVDRLIEDPPGVLEIKTANREIFFRMKREGLPQGYISQLQYALYVTGCQFGAYAVIWPDGWKMLHWDVEADPDLQSMIALECISFWERFIQGAEEPERLNPKEKRCGHCIYRTSCQGKALLEVAGQEEGEIGFDSALTDLASEYIELRDIAAEADAMKEAAADALKKALGDRTAVETEGCRIYYRPQTSMRFDTTGFSKKYPDLAREWKKPSISRPLRLFAR
jgi:predicted phage-related endonuclease